MTTCSLVIYTACLILTPSGVRVDIKDRGQSTSVKDNASDATISQNVDDATSPRKLKVVTWNLGGRNTNAFEFRDDGMQAKVLMHKNFEKMKQRAAKFVQTQEERKQNADKSVQAREAIEKDAYFKMKPTTLLAHLKEVLVVPRADDNAQLASVKAILSDPSDQLAQRLEQTLNKFLKLYPRTEANKDEFKAAGKAFTKQWIRDDQFKSYTFSPIALENASMVQEMDTLLKEEHGWQSQQLWQKWIISVAAQSDKIKREHVFGRAYLDALIWRNWWEIIQQPTYNAKDLQDYVDSYGASVSAKKQNVGRVLEYIARPFREYDLGGHSSIFPSADVIFLQEMSDEWTDIFKRDQSTMRNEWVGYDLYHYPGVSKEDKRKEMALLLNKATFEPESVSEVDFDCGDSNKCLVVRANLTGKTRPITLIAGHADSGGKSYKDLLAKLSSLGTDWVMGADLNSKVKTTQQMLKPTGSLPGLVVSFAEHKGDMHSTQKERIASQGQWHKTGDPDCSLKDFVMAKGRTCEVNAKLVNKPCTGWTSVHPWKPGAACFDESAFMPMNGFSSDHAAVFAEVSCRDW